MILTKRAKTHLRHIISYVMNVLKNPDAARSVRQDAKTTKHKLTYLAESIKLCEEPELARRRYRVIFFQSHNYLMLYRVHGNVVYIDGIYHGSQNYQNLF